MEVIVRAKRGRNLEWDYHQMSKCPIFSHIVYDQSMVSFRAYFPLTYYLHFLPLCNYLKMALKLAVIMLYVRLQRKLLYQSVWYLCIISCWKSTANRKAFKILLKLIIFKKNLEWLYDATTGYPDAVLFVRNVSLTMRHSCISVVCTNRIQYVYLVMVWVTWQRKYYAE